MRKESRAPLALVMLGLTVLTAALFVTTRIVFLDQPDIQNVFSILWTVALVVALYRFAAARSLRPGQMYGLVRFLLELISVLTLLVAGIMAVIVLTSPGGTSIQLVATIAITALLALLLLATPRVLRLFHRRDEVSDKG